MPHNHYLGNYLGKYPDYPIVGRSQVASSIHDEIDSSRLVGMQTSRGGVRAMSVYFLAMQSCRSSPGRIPGPTIEDGAKPPVDLCLGGCQRRFGVAPIE